MRLDILESLRLGIVLPSLIILHTLSKYFIHVHGFSYSLYFLCYISNSFLYPKNTLALSFPRISPPNLTFFHYPIAPQIILSICLVLNPRNIRVILYKSSPSLSLFYQLLSSVSFVFELFLKSILFLSFLPPQTPWSKYHHLSFILLLWSLN